MSAWLLKGYKDISGNIVPEDRFVPDNIILHFEDDKTLVLHAKNLPNHPTVTFPAPRGSGDKNPSYIQEHAYTYYLPLHPTRNPNAVAMSTLQPHLASLTRFTVFSNSGKISEKRTAGMPCGYSFRHDRPLRRRQASEVAYLAWPHGPNSYSEVHLRQLDVDFLCPRRHDSRVEP